MRSRRLEDQMLWDMLLRLGEKPNCSGIVSELWLKRKSYEFQMYDCSPLRDPQLFEQRAECKIRSILFYCCSLDEYGLLTSISA